MVFVLPFMRMIACAATADQGTAVFSVIVSMSIISKNFWLHNSFFFLRVFFPFHFILHAKNVQIDMDKNVFLASFF